MPSQLSLFERMTFRGMLLAPMMLGVLLAGCESKSPTEEAKKMEKPQAGAAMEQAASRSQAGRGALQPGFGVRQTGQARRSEGCLRESARARSE
jgi:hypothetical protein